MRLVVRTCCPVNAPVLWHLHHTHVIRPTRRDFLTHPTPAIAQLSSPSLPVLPLSQCQPAVRFRPRAQPNFATTTFSTARGPALRHAKACQPHTTHTHTLSASYREATGTREKGMDSDREFCGTPGNQGKVSNPDLEPHVLQLLRRFSGKHPCGWPGSTLILPSSLLLPPAACSPLIPSLARPPLFCLLHRHSDATPICFSISSRT